VPALHAALPLEEVNSISMPVGEDLELDVPRALQQLLEVQRLVAERRGRDPPGSFESRREIGDAFTRTGKPSRPAAAASAASPVAAPSEPGTTGTPASLIRARARSLSPIPSIASAGGPIQTRPAVSTARANSALSARKPYPGWIASAPEDRAASRMRGIER
jgi:hypothetical protein